MYQMPDDQLTRNNASAFSFPERGRIFHCAHEKGSPFAAYAAAHKEGKLFLRCPYIKRASDHSRGSKAESASAIVRRKELT